MISTMKMNKTVIVGATGLVGTAILNTLERLPLDVDELVPLASERSAGTKISFKNEEIEVKKFDPQYFEGARWVFFSGKDGLSEQYCPEAVRQGAWVIDNSAAFRMDPDTPLVVPEINMHAVGDTPRIIANPNCSTIQLAVALAPIRDKFGLKKVIVSTYQSASGAGLAYLDDLLLDTSKILDSSMDAVSQDSLAFNCLPAVGSPAESGRFSEETKLENELKKILEMDDLKVSATAVRVPVMISHSESVVIETCKPADPEDVRELLASSEGIRVLDELERRDFPTPRKTAGTDPVWVGRIRRAGVFDNDLAFWVVADNLLKGAALNAVQVAIALNDAGK